MKISDFEEYGVKTGTSKVFEESAPEAKLRSTRELVKTPTLGNLSELAWRLGLALSAINCVVLALALASVNPRGGRSGNIILVVLTFVVYNNLVSLGTGITQRCRCAPLKARRHENHQTIDLW